MAASDCFWPKAAAYDWSLSAKSGRLHPAAMATITPAACFGSGSGDIGWSRA